MHNAADPTRWQGDPLAGEVDPTAALDDRAAGDGLARPWGLSVQHYPAVGICVVVVEGELDVLTAPLLEQRVREQLVAAPAHLILDLEPVSFLGSSGLSGLLVARELALTSGVQLHLAGLITRVVARSVEVTGLLGAFSTYPTLLQAVIELADQEASTAADVVPPLILTVFWRSLLRSVWILELCEFNHGPGLGTVVDWINSGVSVTQPAPDIAQELLAVHGLWLFRDPSDEFPAGSRHRIGYACADAELVMLADLVRDDAARAGLHPMMLAAWVAAGYSTDTAAGWIRAGCPLPR